MRNILLLTRYRLKSRYRGTYAGFFWVILNPLLMFLAQALIFKEVLQLAIENYALFLFSGLVPWIFITMTLQMGVNALEDNSSVIKSFNISPLSIVISYVLENFITLSLLLILLLTFLLFNDQVTSSSFFLLPIPYFFVVSATILGTFSLSLMQIFYKDTKYIISFLISICFFITPIFYPRSFVPEPYLWVVDFNPFHIMIAPLRQCLYHFSTHDFIWQMLWLITLNVVLLLWSRVMWLRTRFHIHHAI